MQNQNTLSNEKKAVNGFKLYLGETGVEDTDFFTYTESELDKYPKLFWFNAKKQNGEKLWCFFHGNDEIWVVQSNKEYGHNFYIT